MRHILYISSIKVLICSLYRESRTVINTSAKNKLNQRSYYKLTLKVLHSAFKKPTKFHTCLKKKHWLHIQLQIRFRNFSKIPVFISRHDFPNIDHPNEAEAANSAQRINNHPIKSYNSLRRSISVNFLFDCFSFSPIRQ